MCFSAEADLVTGIVVGAVGIDALRHVRKPHQIALAATPAIFALHEIDRVLRLVGTARSGFVSG